MNQNHDVTTADCYGNNCAVICKKCGQAYCVSSFLNQGIRDCPHCGKSTAVYQSVKKEWDSMSAKQQIGNEQTATRLSFKQEWRNHNVWVTFTDQESGTTYRYPHDEVLKVLIEQYGIIKGTRCWEKPNGLYNRGTLGNLEKVLEPYIVK
jgi:predicted  nucleic acid-binding Zn-ribbon protein